MDLKNPVVREDKMCDKTRQDLDNTYMTKLISQKKKDQGFRRGVYLKTILPPHTTPHTTIPQHHTTPNTPHNK